MQNKSSIIAFSCIFLLACGGSDSETATETSKNNSIENLANTSWKKECSPKTKSPVNGSPILWYVNSSLRIDSSLKATYVTEFFRPTDTLCNSMVYSATDISIFDIKGRVISEESIAANALNETFLYRSEESNPSPNYTLIYIDTERLYFGQESGSNLGKTPETRHSSISLDDYFSQVIK